MATKVFIENEQVYTMYNPFFIRKSETKKFVLEKMRNCIVERMVILQKRWQKKQENN